MKKTFKITNVQDVLYIIHGSPETGKSTFARKMFETVKDVYILDDLSPSQPHLKKKIVDAVMIYLNGKSNRFSPMRKFYSMFVFITNSEESASYIYDIIIETLYTLGKGR